LIGLSITVHGEFFAKMEGLPKRLQDAIEAKMRVLTDKAYAKAVGNFSNGKYNSTEEVAHGVERQGNLVIGFIEPLTLKARIQETGGERYYEILPVKARVLRFIGKQDGQLVNTKYVLHPPIPGKHYIRDTIAAMATEIRDELNATIDIENKR
jgi:hypothetical protein